LAQESFASIYVHRQNYKPKHEFKTYLYAVVRNKCIDFCEKERRSLWLTGLNLSWQAQNLAPSNPLNCRRNWITRWRCLRD
ncbi:MAG: hypothetical protein GX971_04280, partial [Firmicutes bacterium]|nr:hypothetical protein [Bacillota bacterium]